MCSGRAGKARQQVERGSSLSRLSVSGLLPYAEGSHCLPKPPPPASFHAPLPLSLRLSLCQGTHTPALGWPTASAMPRVACVYARLLPCASTRPPARRPVFPFADDGPPNCAPGGRGKSSVMTSVQEIDAPWDPLRRAEIESTHSQSTYY